MTRKERRYLFIIYTLLLKIDYIVKDTNSFITDLEAQVNQQLEERVQRQIEADSKVLELWETNVQTLLDENERIEAEREKLRGKLKEKRRLMRME